MSDFVDGDDNTDADTQQPTLCLDACHNNDDDDDDDDDEDDDNDDNKAILWSDAFNNDGKYKPYFWCNNQL